MTTRARFLAKVEHDEVTGCWLWTGAISAKGYGRFGYCGRNALAHGVAYEIFVGPLPADGLQFDHLCRVRNCVNPAHLERVTPRENTRRGLNHNRAKTHCAHGHPFDAANTYFASSGRACRMCRRSSTAAFSARVRRARGAPVAPALRTHCPQGHPYDEANTFYEKNGSRKCRTCRAKRSRERSAARRRGAELSTR